MPFLENVTRGRNVPRERLEEVAHHYELFGGVSPINRQNRELIAALEPELRAHGIDLPICLRQPQLAPVPRGRAARAARRRARAACSRSSPRRSARTRAAASTARTSTARRPRSAPDAPEVLKLRAFYNHPGFVEANADRVRDALRADPGGAPRGRAARLHRAQHPGRDGRALPLRRPARRDGAPRRRGRRRRRTTRVVYQSRSGPPQVPWLEPDVCDHLPRARTAAACSDVGHLAGRLRLRPPRGALRPRRRGGRARRGARA